MRLRRRRGRVRRADAGGPRATVGVVNAPRPDDDVPVDSAAWDAGLPAAVPARVRARNLAERCAPAWALVAYVVFSRTVFMRAVSEEEFDALLSSLDDGVVLDSLVFPFLAVVAGAVAMTGMIWLLIRALPARPRRVVAWLLLVLAIASPSIGSAVTVHGSGAGEYRDWVSVLPAAAVAVVVFLGWGHLVWWVLARSVREVPGTLVRSVRTLPLLLVAFLFFFYNAELWQLAAQWSALRAAAVALVFWSLAAVAAMVTVNDHVREVLGADERRHRLRVRVNVRFSAASIHVAQASVLAVIVFAGFVALGVLSVPDETIRQWVGVTPPQIQLGSLTIPVVLVKVSWALAGFAALYHVTATAGDVAAREAQLGPVTDGMRRALAG